MINGLDISSYQEQPQYGRLIDWKALKADPRNFRFIWIKVAEGASLSNYNTDDAARQVAGAQSVSFEAINLYHYYWYRFYDTVAGKWVILPAADQAALFYDACVKIGYLPPKPMSDCEDPLVEGPLDFSNTPTANAALSFARGLNFHLRDYHQAITDKFKVRPTIYTGAWWWDKLTVQIAAYYPHELDWMKDYFFTLADYDGTLNYPKAVAPSQCIAWQFTSTPTPPVAGIPTGHLKPGDALDCEHWMLSDADFAAWSGTQQPAPAPQPAPTSWQQSIDAWARTMGYTGPKPV